MVRHQDTKAQHNWMMTQVQPDTSRQLVQGSWGSCDKGLNKHQEEGAFLCSMHAMYQLLLDPLSPLAPSSAVQRHKHNSIK